MACKKGETYCIKDKAKTQKRYKRYRGKEIPLQPWRGPENSSRLRFPNFKTIDT
jgi:hypothetical protein